MVENMGIGIDVSGADFNFVNSGRCGIQAVDNGTLKMCIRDSPRTLHHPKGSFTNPQGIYLVEKRTLQNAKSFFLAGLAGFEPTR